MDFRPMRRFKQQLSNEEAVAILSRAKRGVLSLVGDKYFPSREYTENEIKMDGARVNILELTIEHITGKHVKEK